MTSAFIRAFRNSFIYLAFAGAAVAASGDVDSSFLTGMGVGMTGPQYPNPQGPTGATQALGIQADGKIIVGSGGGMSRHNNTGELTALKRLLPDGTLDPAFAPNQAFVNGPHTTVSGQVSEVNAILVNEDGSFFIGGVFEKYGADGTVRTLLAKVNADGTLNTTFIPPAFNTNGGGRYVQSLALDAQGGLLVGGAFSASGKQNLVRLDALTGSVDSLFDANTALAGFNRVVDCVTVANDGRIYVSGAANNFPMAKRLLSGGQEDSSFTALFVNDYGRVNRILPLPNGRVLLGGNYDLQGTPQVDFLTAHTSTGALDNTFMSNLGTMTNGWVGGLLKLMPDGRILAGGIYNNINGTPIASLAILNEDGVRDATFTPVPYNNVRTSYVTHIYDAVVQPNGKIVAGGWFSRITDPALEINNLVRFEGEAAAGAGRLKFSSTSYSILENAGTAKVQVARVGGISGAVSVSYTTGGSGSTAVAGTDYTTTSGTLNWADGEAGAKTISIPITNNAVAAAAKTLRVTISSPTGGASLSTPVQTTVNLLDDDSAPTIFTQPASVTLNQGSTLRLSVVPDSPLPVTYQWQYNASGSFANINGATTRELTITQVTPTAHAGQYRVLVTNANGTTISAAGTVTVLTPAGSLVPTFNSTLVGRTIGAAAPDGQGRWIVLTSLISPSTRTLQRLLANGTVDTTFIESTFDSSVSTIHVLADGRILVAGFFDNITSPTGGTVTAKKDLARFLASGALDTAYNPSLPAAAGSNGNLSAEVITPAANGSYYVGFGSGGGLRRYLADGSVDTSFTPPATIGNDLNGQVGSIVELSSGKILVAHMTGRNGSGFTYNLVRLNADGSVDSSFKAVSAIGGQIEAVHVFAGGQRIAIGGGFSGLNGTFNPGARMALLDASGNADTSFVSPFANNDWVVSKILDQGGKLVIAGSFTAIGGQPPQGIARLRYDGSIDSSFVVGAGTNGNVNALHLTADNNLFIAGNFTQVNGITKNYAAVLLGNSDVGTVGFSPARFTYTEAARTISLDVVRYGSTTDPISVQWATADAATGVTAVASTDYTAALGTLTWAAGDAATKTVTITLLDDSVQEATKNFRVVLSEPQGSVTTGANATITLLDSDTPVTFTTQPAARTTLLTGDTLTLTTAATSPTSLTYQWYLNGTPVPGATSATLSRTNITQSQAGLYVAVATNAAGSFSSNAAQVVVTPRSGGIAAEQATSGRPSFTGSNVMAIQALPDGGALVGGTFSANAGFNLNQGYLIRLRPDGSTDTTFSLVLNNSVTALHLQPDGKILVGGNFTTPASRLLRLNADAALSLDTAFNTNVGTSVAGGGSVSDLALDSQNRIYLSTDVRPNSGTVYRFAANGTLDSGYNVVFNHAVMAIAVQTDDKVLAAGFFTQYAGNSVSRFIRLNTDGTRDTNFTSGLGGNANYNDLLVLKDGRIFAAGSNFANSAVLALVEPTGAFGSNMGSSSQVYELSQAPNGKVVVARASSGGSGTVYRIKASNPLPIPGSTDGDATFSIGTGPDADVKVISHGHDGSIWLAGDFTSFNGVATGGVVKLIGDPGDPGIVNPPVTVGVNAEATAQFAVGAVGTNLTYQWFKNGAPLTDGGRITGATATILTIANVTASDDDFYTVAITGGTTVNTVTSVPVRLNMLGAPVIVTSPQSVTPALGSLVTLTADVLAATPSTYEWRRDGVLIVNGGRYSGANTDTLVIAAGNNADNGSYVLKVTNSLGTASTIAATVVVNQIPADRDGSTLALGTSSTNSSNFINNFLHLPDGRTLIAARGNLVGAGNTNVGNQMVIVETDGRITAPAAGNFSGDGVSGFYLQSDGKILVYGSFTQVGGQSGLGRTRLARLNADLTLDTSFVAIGPSNTPRGVVVDTLGRIYMVGSFNNYDNQNGYSYLVRLSPNGVLDSSFKPVLNNSINEIVKLPNGKILVAGNFSSYSPEGTAIPASALLCLNADGSVDTTFNSSLPESSFVQSIAVDSAGRIIVARSNTPYTLLRLLPSGAVDSSFNFTETLSIFPQSMTVLPSGKILVGGQFTTPKNRLFRLLENGSLDASFDVGVGINSGSVAAISADHKGRIWVGGSGFTQYKGEAVNRLVVLQGDGAVLQFTTQPFGKVVDLGAASVQFTAVATGNNGFTYQWKKNGVVITDDSRSSGATTGTLTIQNVVQTDAAAYTVTVTSPSGNLTSNSASLTVLAGPEITLDPTAKVVAMGETVSFSGAATGASPLTYQWLRFGTPVSNGGGVSGATTPTLTIAGADFTHVGNYSLRVTNSHGAATTEVANLTVEKRPGTLAGDRPQPTFGGDVNAIHMYADGSYLVGGNFTNVIVNGQQHNHSRLARFNADGSLDTSFVPSFNNAIYAIAVDSSGRIFVGGHFTSVTLNSTTTNVIRVARFTSGLALDTTFSTATAGPNNIVRALAPLDNGSVYIGGNFTAIGSVNSADVRAVARLSTDGSLDTGFKSQINTNAVVNTLMRRGNKLLIGAQNNAWGSASGAGVFMVSATGALDTSFDSPGATSQGMHFNELADGSLFVGQNSPGNYAQRYNATTGATLGFAPNPGQAVYASAQQTDGKLVLGGLFNTSFGTYFGFAPYLYRAAVDGSVDNDFNIGTGFNSSVNALALDSRGRIYVGGSFNAFNGMAQNRFAILTGGNFESRDGLLPSQTITFAAPANRTFNPAANTFAVSPTSSSGLPVTVAVTNGPATMMDNTVIINGAGQVTLTATQAGNTSFAAATPVSHTFTVSKAAQTITFNPPNRSISNAPFDLTATASSGLAVTYEFVSGPADLVGSQITLHGTVGTVIVRAIQGGDTNWEAAPSLERSFEVQDVPVEPEPQTITFGAIANRDVEDGPLTLSATATSGLPVTFTLVSGPATLTGSVLTPTGASGTVVVRAQQAGDAAWLAADAVTRSFFVTGDTPVVPVAQTITFVTPASRYLDEITLLLDGYASSGLPVIYEVSGPASVVGNVLTLTGTGTVTVTATQPGNDAFIAAKPVVRKIKILPEPTKLTLTNLVQTYTGTPRSVGYLGVDEGTDVTLTYAGSATPPTKAGKYAVLAVAGSTKKTGSLVINKAPLFVTVDNQSKLAGTVNPELTLGYSGFLAGDTEESVFNDPTAKPAAKRPTLSTTAKETSAGGEYPIKAAGAVAANYTFAYTNGTLTVEGFQGKYEALLTSGVTSLPVAKVEITVATTSKTYSGKLTIASETAALAFKGSLTTDTTSRTSSSTVTVKKGSNTYVLNFTLPLEGSFSANLKNGSAQDVGETIFGQKLFVLAKGEKLAHAGAHTLILAPGIPVSAATSPVPLGAGHATANVDAKGVLKIAGKLPDGTTLTAALAADSEVGYRLFALPYKRIDSYIAGSLALTDHPDLEGRKYVAYASNTDWAWAKTEGQKDKAYRGGFGPIKTRVTLDPWIAPAKGTLLAQSLDLASTGEIQVFHSSITSASFPDLPTLIALDAKNKVTVKTPAANATKWTLSITPNTGAFKGSFTLNDAKPRKVSFTGVLRQPPSTDSEGILGGGNIQIPAQPTDTSNEVLSAEIQLQQP